MLLQETDPLHEVRLSRVVLLGDHHQLPPIVRHQALQKYSHLDQSMFARFIRLGVPFVQLDQQGRSRPAIAALYSWRYHSRQTKLGDLPLVQELPVYRAANAGFCYTYQFINVEDFQGKGETCPTPFFYQNLGEAEYVVAVYQFMRLLGYPAEKISILTTYNGQKSLIRDIVQKRCAGNPIFGRPGSIQTVDQFQGQQNDYILLSLVRTSASVGHIRDIRRLVVALSRARLGLYIFGRRQCFEGCVELLPAMSRLIAGRGCSLMLVAGESHPTPRLAADDEHSSSFSSSATSSSSSAAALKTESVMEVSDVSAMGVLVYQMVQQSQALQSLGK